MSLFQMCGAGSMDEEFLATLIGPLPPIKSISPYCKELLTAVSKRANVEFVGFKKLYPDILFPGGSVAESEGHTCTCDYGTARIRNILTYYNPFSWIWAGITIKGNVVHAQWWSHILAPQYLTILALCKLRGKKIVITVHNVVPHEKNRISILLNHSVMCLGDAFIVHSNRNIEELHSILEISRDRIHRIPIGISNCFSEGDVSKQLARERLDLPSDKKILLFFGNIREYKGLDILLKAFVKVLEERSDVLLVIAGKPWIRWDPFEEIIDKNEIRQNIRLFLDFIPSEMMRYFYVSADMVVLPYKEFTSQSAIAADALAFSKPLIVADVGGLPELVKEKRMVIKPNNPDALAAKILETIEDGSLLQKLAQDAKELSIEYSWDNVGLNTIQLYQKVLGEE